MEERTLLILNQVDNLLKKSRNEEAEYMLLHSLDFEETHLQYMKLGYIYSIQIHRLHDAAGAYRKALQLNKDDAEIMILLGEVLYRAGKKQEALNCFLNAIKSNPCRYTYRAYFFLALLYQNWNRPERSLRFLNLCLKCKSDYIPAVKMLNLLKNKYLPSTGISSG